MRLPSAVQTAKYCVYFAVAYLLCFAAAMALFPIRPFWNDEWRLLFNIKFKTIPALWGRLDLLQECPRTYLSALKIVMAAFDYKYSALRLPSLIVSLGTVALCFRLHKKLLFHNPVFGYLFLLIFFSSQTFTDYLVQVKHYEPELFCCMLALWQLQTMFFMLEQGNAPKGKFILLCISFVVAPFFSYTYAVSVAPVFCMITAIAVLPLGKPRRAEQRHVSRLIMLALVLGAASIMAMYAADLRQVMANSAMYKSYRDMLGYKGASNHFLENVWQMFALVGSGLVFEIIFGVLGSAAFLWGIMRVFRKHTELPPDNEISLKVKFRDLLNIYCIALIVLTIALLFSGKLMGGVARLTAFTVPAIALQIVFGLEKLQEIRLGRVANVIAIILFLGLSGNIISCCINTFTYPEYANRILTFRKCAEALEAARVQKLPLLYTDGVRGDVIPDKPTSKPGLMERFTITPAQIAGVDNISAEVILKVNPAYEVGDSITLYHVPDTYWAQEYVNLLPQGITAAIVTDGVHYRKVNKQ
jgi:hypothetical protein